MINFKAFIFSFFIIFGFAPGTGTAGHQVTIQFNINKILNARPVSVLNYNRIITWKKGIDGQGRADGYLTYSAAAFNQDTKSHALPDNSLFPANKMHPAIKLHYANYDSFAYQARGMSGEGAVLFNVPKAKYKTVFLALTSAEGATKLRVVLNYTGGSVVKDYTVPDYYQDIPENDPNFCYLAHDLAKWGPKNNMTEKNHHNIDLLKIETDDKRTLKSIKISKTRPGYLVFWAAAEVAM